MSVPAQDGAWITATTPTIQIYCSVCGFVLTTTYITNDKELQELILDHLEQHGGRLREGTIL